MLPHDYISFAEKVYNWFDKLAQLSWKLDNEKASTQIYNWLFDAPFYIKSVLQLSEFYLNTHISSYLLLYT